MQWREQEDDSDNELSEAPRATERSLGRRGTGTGAMGAEAMKRRHTGHPHEAKPHREGGGSRAPSPPSGSGSKSSERLSPDSEGHSESAQQANKGALPGEEESRDKSVQKLREYQATMTEKIFQAVTV